MNGVRSIFRRKGYLLTALTAAVLLAASSGTAYAQGEVSDISVSLASATVDEGGQATATLKFTVTAGEFGVGANPIQIGFGFHLGDPALTPNLAGAVAGDESFIGLSEMTDDNEQIVQISALSRAGRKKDYTVKHTFGLNHDLDAEDARFKLTVDIGETTSEDSDQNATGITDTDPTAFLDSRTYTIKDDEVQKYTLSLPSSKEGVVDEGDMDVEVQLTADPRRTHENTVPMFTVVGPSGFFTDTAEESDIDTALGGGDAVNQGAPADTPVGTISTTISTDKNRVDDTMTLQLYVGGVGDATVAHELAITVVDVEKLPSADNITADAADEDGKKVTEIVEGGDPVYLTITVDRGNENDPKNRTTEETLAVAVQASAAQAGDYEVEVEGGSITLGDGEESTDLDIKLWALEDEDVGDEDLELQLVVSGLPGTPSGTSTGTFPITIVDKTTKQVAPKSLDEAYPVIMAEMAKGAGDDEKLNPGESFSVKTSDLFTLADGYTAAYGASVEGGGVSVSASGDTITVDAISATDGEAKVTVTATAKMAASSFIPSQTVSNIAEITFPVTVVDKALVVTVEADPATIMEGGTSTITATANRAIEAGDGAVEIGLEVVGDATVEPGSIMIAMGEMSGSAVLTAAEDDDYADGTVTVVATGSGIDAPRQVTIAVMDNDEEPVVVDPVPENTIWPRPQGEAYPVITGAIDGAAGDDGLNPGESFSVPAGDLFEVMDGYEASYSASVDNGDVASASVSGDSVMVTADAAGAAKVTISGTSRMASSSFAPEQVATNMADITFEVMVVDTALVVTVAADPAEIMEGGTSTITATANRAVVAGDGAVEIALEVVGDATVEPESITIAMGDMSGSAMLTAAEDDDYADGSVTVVATGGGIDAARQVTIAVMDNDEEPVVVEPEPTNTIEPKSQDEAYPVITGAIEMGAGEDGLNPGESFSVMASALFTVMDGYTASYSASVDGAAATASVSGDSVDVMAAAAGEAKVTITGTSKMASSSFEASQDATNVASITFPVMVVDKPLVALVVTLGMPANVMNGNIVEGESYDIVVSANRMVTEDTEVMIMRDRAASDAGEDDYSVSSATIMAGYDSATATLMVTEDMEPDSGTNDNMGESLVLYGMAGDMETNSLTFTIWDQAVPSLPLIGQLLLALFLMLGGARLYRRRQG